MVERILFSPGGATENKQDVIISALGGTISVADSGEKEYTHITSTITALGNTTVYTPQPGKRIRLHWIYAINDPTASAAPLIKVSLGATEIYRVWALSKRQLKTGAVDAPLVINLSITSGTVAFTAILEEV